MSIPNPNAPERRFNSQHKIILRSEIEEAQRHTNSNMAAARWLNIGYKTYKKYAKLYGLFDQHLNPHGMGIEKGFSKKPTSVPLRDVLAGKHPGYSLAKLKNRLIARNKIEEKCTVCNFSERRITDNRVPLMLTFIDGNKRNYALDNLELRCYNCMFLTTGAPTVVHREAITKSLQDPEKYRKREKPMLTGDYYDALDMAAFESIVLTPEEQQALLDSLEEI